jgi:hypothetical protein
MYLKANQMGLQVINHIVTSCNLILQIDVWDSNLRALIGIKVFHWPSCLGKKISKLLSLYLDFKLLQVVVLKANITNYVETFCMNRSFITCKIS